MTELNFYHGYNQELKSRRIRINEVRWNNVLIFRKYLLHHQQWNGCIVLHALRKLSISFFKYEKQRYISRPNFIICLKENNLTVNTSRALSIYDSFDILQKNAFDWRTFIFMLFVTFRGVHENVKHLLMYAFRFYLGQFEDVDKPCNSKVKLLNIDVILEMLIRPDKVECIIELFDHEWTKFPRQSRNIRSMSGDNTISSNVTLDAFSNILESLPVFQELENMEQLTRFEEEYYPQPLFKHRRCLRYMASFIELATTKTQTSFFIRWKMTTKRRERMRQLCYSICRRKNVAVLSLALEKLWYNTIMHVASIAIQCAYRVFSSKVISAEKHYIKASATTMQKVSRGFLARQQYTKQISKRDASAKAIQRCIRGTLSRHVAHRRLLTLIDTMRLKQLKEEELQSYNRTVYFAIKMQRRYREKIARQVFNQAVEKKQRELRVMSEMQSLLLDEEKEQAIHRKQTEVYIDYAIDQWKVKKMTERKTMLDRAKVQKLHLKMKDIERKEQDRKREQQQDEYVQLMKEKLKDEWAHIEQRECDAFVTGCLACLRAPETASERKRGRELKMMIRKRLVI